MYIYCQWRICWQISYDIAAAQFCYMKYYNIFKYMKWCMSWRLMIDIILEIERIILDISCDVCREDWNILKVFQLDISCDVCREDWNILKVNIVGSTGLFSWVLFFFFLKWVDYDDYYYESNSPDEEVFYRELIRE